MVLIRSTPSAQVVNRGWAGPALYAEEQERIDAARRRAERLRDQELDETIACATAVVLMLASLVVLRFGPVAVGWVLS